LTVTEEGGGLFFYGTQGERRVGLATHEKGGVLFLNDTKGEPRAGLNVD
jgi:hypothetical protein